MKKLTVIKVINAMLFFSFVIQASTGLSMMLDLKGEAGEIIDEIHGVNGVILILLVAAHVYLFWGIVKNHYFKKTA